MIYLLFSEGCPCFKPIIENMYYLLKKNNIPSQIKNIIDVEEKDSDRWLCIWNNLPRLPKKCIIYNFDPMVDNVFNSLLGLIKSSNSTIVKFVDYCYGNNYDRLKIFNLDYIVLPYGYSKYHEYIYQTLVNKNINYKPIDILFYGNMNQRRKDIITLIDIFCKANNYVFVYTDKLNNETDKTNVIQQSKIVLSISNSDAKIYKTNDLARLSYLISNKALVVTEYIGDKVVEDKLSKYTNYCTTIEEIIDKIQYYISNPDDRIKSVDNAYNCFKTDFDFEKGLIDILEFGHCPTLQEQGFLN